MTDTQLAPRDHNNPPSSIDEITAAYEAEREMAEGWADGAPVENEAQMNEVDALRKAMRQWRLDLERGQKSATAPLNDALTAERNRWRPVVEDAKRIEQCLVATVDSFKRKLAEKKRAEEQAAWEAANKAKREAEEKARAAEATKLEAQRDAEDSKRQAMEAEKAAQEATRTQVRGLRTVKETIVLDPVALARHLWEHDREALDAFMLERARKLKLHVSGVVEIQERKEAY